MPFSRSRGGCAIPACIAGGIPACLAAGLQEGCVRHTVNERPVRILLECIILYKSIQKFLSIYWVKWVTDPFAPKCYSKIQNHIGPNIGDDVNIVTV